MYASTFFLFYPCIFRKASQKFSLKWHLPNQPSRCKVFLMKGIMSRESLFATFFSRQSRSSQRPEAPFSLTIKMQDGFPQCELWPQRASLAPYSPLNNHIDTKTHPGFLTVLTQALASNRKVHLSLESIKRFPTSISISQFPQSRYYKRRCVYIKTSTPPSQHTNTILLHTLPKIHSNSRAPHFLSTPLLLSRSLVFLCANWSIFMYEDQ